jgi:hypothetical protein
MWLFITTSMRIENALTTPVDAISNKNIKIGLNWKKKGVVLCLAKLGEIIVHEQATGKICWVSICKW